MHVVRLHLDDIVIVGQLARLGAETEVVDGREFEGTGLEAVGPLVGGFVLQFDSEGIFLVVGEADLGRY